MAQTFSVLGCSSRPAAAASQAARASTLPVAALLSAYFQFWQIIALI